MIPFAVPATSTLSCIHSCDSHGFCIAACLLAKKVNFNIVELFAYIDSRRLIIQ